MKNINNIENVGVVQGVIKELKPLKGISRIAQSFTYLYPILKRFWNHSKIAWYDPCCKTISESGLPVGYNGTNLQYYNNITNTYTIIPNGGGSVILPNPIEYTVSSSAPTALSPIENAGTTAILTSFIGFNVEFIRNKINETTDVLDSSFYTYNKITGQITIFPAATVGERFKFKLS